MLPNYSAPITPTLPTLLAVEKNTYPTLGKRVDSFDNTMVETIYGLIRPNDLTPCIGAHKSKIRTGNLVMGSLVHSSPADQFY
jgi:hypothetical protein